MIVTATPALPLPPPDEFCVVVLVRQPVVATKASEPINNSGSAFFNGILIYRFIILAIGFIFSPLSFSLSRDSTLQRDAKR
jgi:hypothetical protein